MFAIENPVIAVLARQRDPGGERLVVAVDDIVAAGVLGDPIGPETMRVRGSAARRVDLGGDGFAVRPWVICEGRSLAENESGG